MNPLSSLAPAIKDLASAQKSSFATTQAVWRFLNNPHISFQQLNHPIETLALSQVSESNSHYALVAHDWSQLQYVKHSHKSNRQQRTHKHDVGYELQSSLLIDAESGLPIAPLAQTLCDASGRYMTYAENGGEKATHLNALFEQITSIESMSINKKLVHIIDREGDSIAHLRQLSQQGYNWLVRGKEGNRIEYQGQALKVKDVADQTTTTFVKTVQYKGQSAILHVGESPIDITRDAQSSQKTQEGKRVAPMKGEALQVRLIMAKVTDKTGKPLARWTLLSNVSKEVSCTELANWYYWRWTIESYFKLLKQAGHDVESWLQTTPQAILKRLQIACMACVLTWRIQRSTDEQNTRVRAILTRLSGRQQKRGRIESAPSILAGLSILLNTLQLLSEYSESELKEMAQIALGLGYLQRDV
jgi:hypothetical protein